MKSPPCFLIRFVLPLICLWSSVTTVKALEVTARFELSPTPLGSCGDQPFTRSDLIRATSNGLERVEFPSIGSGLARISDGEFVGISDRGPNGEVNGKRTFPLPGFSPFIARFKLRDGKIELLHTIVLTDSHGKPLTGLSNQEGEERLYESAGRTAPLPFDPGGVDPEAIRVFPDGRFLTSEEYGPSLLVVNTNGQVLMRYVPENKFLTNAAYPVKAVLPRILSQRRTNRGFEALALSPDGRTAFVMLQSPLGDEADATLANARVSRAIRLDMTDPLDARVIGHFLMPLSRATDYSPKQKQSGIKLNDAEWLADGRLLVLEQAGKKARLVVADFNGATDLKNRSEALSMKFEAAGDGFSTLAKTASVETFAFFDNPGAPDTKLEGLAILSPTEIVISNDNDFGMGGKSAEHSSMIWNLRLPSPLPISR
jgi:alkaline phosphatase